MGEGIDHDGLFKELLGTFFMDLLELFAPELAAEVEPGSLKALPPEKSLPLVLRQNKRVDILMQVRLRGCESAVIVHTEAQARRQATFPERMFTYMAYLWLKHRLPTYPIAVLSFDSRRAQPDEYVIALPGLTPLRYRYRVVHLRRLSWRDYRQRPNPVAAALMSKMGYAESEREQVKFECFLMLAGLGLDPERRALVSAFVDAYLKLSPAEEKLYEKRVSRLAPAEREKVMEITTSWKEAGRVEGRAEGRAEERTGLVLRLLARRCGELSAATQARIQRLSLDQLGDLGEALLDFDGAADLRRWLAEQAPRPSRTAVRTNRPHRTARARKPTPRRG